MDPRFKAAIAKRLKARRGKLARPPRQLHPDPAERAYAAALVKMVAAMKKLVDIRLVPRIQSVINQRNALLPAGIKQDAWPTDISDAFRNIKDEFTRQYSPDEVRAIARKMGLSVAEFNALQVERGFRRVVGIDVFASEPWLVPQLQAFTAQNVSLISDLPTKYFSELESGIFEQVANGYRFEEIGKFIEDRTGVASSRAQFIARDQVSTFNGQLTGLRQTNAGVTRYQWITSNDERVRDSHTANAETDNGWGPGIWSWDDPPPQTGHPGEDFQCRCYASPVMESVIEGEASFESGAGEE